MQNSHSSTDMTHTCCRCYGELAVHQHLRAGTRNSSPPETCRPDMSLNSSNNALLHPNRSSVPADINLRTCFFSAPSSIIFISFSITNSLLLFPLCTFILYLGFKRWWKQRSSSSAAALMSHIDGFTYHMVTMELIGVFGYILCCFGIQCRKLNMFMVGFCLSSFNWYAETFFHVLTCVERYLAVVHPITYLSLRSDRGTRIRNVSIGCVWLLCTVASCLKMYEQITLMVDFCVLVSSLIVMSLCSLSVVFVLCRPKPGTQDGQAERIDQSKKRAFYIIVTILAVLIVRVGWNLGWSGAWTSGQVSCVTIMSGIWFNLPCSLVLPLLFLLRAGMLVCSKNNK